MSKKRDTLTKMQPTLDAVSNQETPPQSADSEYINDLFASMAKDRQPMAPETGPAASQQQTNSSPHGTVGGSWMDNKVAQLMQEHPGLTEKLARDLLM